MQRGHLRGSAFFYKFFDRQRPVYKLAAGRTEPQDVLRETTSAFPHKALIFRIDFLNQKKPRVRDTGECQ